MRPDGTHRVIGLPAITFVIFGLWVAAWLAFCFLYGIKHSKLNKEPRVSGR